MAKNGYSMSNRADVEVITADRSVTVEDCGKILTNSGASGALELSLPAPSVAFKGVNFMMVVRTAQNFKVSTAAADTLVARNDATADSVLSAEIGNEIQVYCDGTNWYANGSTHGGSYTIAT
jgi:hypothetical protein|tara:strand:- start:226 stop:591 length:366 start_codon:yes stop_codon:yes gene_type:complete